MHGSWTASAAPTEATVSTSLGEAAGSVFKRFMGAVMGLNAGDAG